MIEQYILAVDNSNSTAPLASWKANEHRFPALALLAEKFLGVPASSANVERMFSIARHIFSLKRRKIGSCIFAVY
jgi:KRAB domain-containing zinc finger protein